MKPKAKISNQGFTTVELLVAMAIAGIVMTAVYTAYYSQQKSYVAQEQVSAMQQNLRAAMHLMARDIRMAGYDPTGMARSGIQTANTDSIRVTMDLTDDTGTGDPDGDTSDANEDVTYALYDADGDGDNDLGRDTGGGNETVAVNTDALNFVYLDEDGIQTTDFLEIRSVQITLVARTDRTDPGYTNANGYSNQVGTTIYTAPGDGSRRRLLTAQVRCRNLGLE